MIAPTAAEHARVRHLFSPGFSDRALKQQEPLFRKYADLLMTKLRDLNGQAVDMTVMNNLTTFDIMAELTFGEPLGLLENSKYTEWVRIGIEAIKALPLVQIIRFYPFLTKLSELCAPKWVSESAKSHFRYSADRVDRRLERGSSRCSTIYRTWDIMSSNQDENDQTNLTCGTWCNLKGTRNN